VLIINDARTERSDEYTQSEHHPSTLSAVLNPLAGICQQLGRCEDSSEISEEGRQTEQEDFHGVAQ